MTALRTTRPRTTLGSTTFPRTLAACAAAVLLGLTGCGGEPRDGANTPPPPDSARATFTPLPPPASERIGCSGHKLTFYELPGAGRWMVKRSDTERAYPVGPEHTLPDGVDPKDTFVFYTRPGGQTSRLVSLADIQAARPEHSSAAR